MKSEIFKYITCLTVGFVLSLGQARVYGQWVQLKAHISPWLSLQDTTGSSFGGGLSGGYVFRNRVYFELGFAYFKGESRGKISASWAPITVEGGYYFGKKKLAPFVGLGFTTFRYNLEIPNKRSQIDFTSYLYAGLSATVGLQYMFSENFGLYAAAKYRLAKENPIFQFIQIDTGIAIRF